MNQTLHTVCIIPARGGSKGIPQKNIIDVAGKPLVAWSIEQALASKYIKDNVYVTSDTQEILNISATYGAKKILRPLEFSTDTATSESALIHAIDKIEKMEDKKVDLVVFLQATSPLRHTKDIDIAIQKLINDDLDSLFSAVELEDFFIWTYEDDKLVSMNYDFLKRQRRQDVQSQYVENGSIYVFKPEILQKENNRLGGNIGLSLMESWKMHEIDTLEDKELCEYYINKRM